MSLEVVNLSVAIIVCIADWAPSPGGKGEDALRRHSRAKGEDALRRHSGAKGTDAARLFDMLYSAA